MSYFAIKSRFIAQHIMKINIPTPALIAIIVVSVLLIGTFGFRAIQGPATTGPQFSSSEKDWMSTTAKRVKGDYNQLTPDEKQRFDKLTQGNSGLAVRSFADQ